MGSLRRKTAATAATLCVLLAPSFALASQIVALDMKPLGKIPKAATETLTPILLTELSRRDGISVVSQFDIIALMEHEGNKQMLGCDDSGCMTQIAGAMGAELLLNSTLGKVGSEWVVTLTLVDTRTSVPVKRAIGREKGDQTAANIALVKAVNDLLSTGLPSHLEGPGSMSQRGFKAALLGYAKALMERGQEQNARDLRQRIVLDLVNTELDYDVEPKMNALDREVRAKMITIRNKMLLAKDTKDLEFILSAQQQWNVVGQDLQRVKEIRTRARERGVAPSPRALRFEPPEPIDRVDPKALARWRKEAAAMQGMLKKMLGALKSNTKETFIDPSHWVDPKRAERAFDSVRKRMERGHAYDLLPFHAMSPWLNKEAVSNLEDRKPTLRLYLREYRDGEIRDADRIYCEQVDGTWKIKSW